MLSNYFKVALRNLFRSKIYSLINISGMAIGLAAFWLIALYVADELSFDRFHEKANRIYRVAHHARWEGGDLHIATTSLPFAGALKAQYPEIEEATRILREGGGIITYNNKSINAGDILFCRCKYLQGFYLPYHCRRL